ncbi:hypothetical protein BDR04DRAFT_1121843 [Suillus decipiens]|nr:hypothetical protein BDR04DRAFT_1121843 [Suillus decipiens]
MQLAFTPEAKNRLGNRGKAKNMVLQGISSNGLSGGANVVSGLPIITAAALCLPEYYGYLWVQKSRQIYHILQALCPKLVKTLVTACNLPKGKYCKWCKTWYCQHNKDFPVTNFGQITSGSDKYPAASLSEGRC